MAAVREGRLFLSQVPLFQFCLEYKNRLEITKQRWQRKEQSVDIKDKLIKDGKSLKKMVKMEENPEKIYSMKTLICLKIFKSQ